MKNEDNLVDENIYLAKIENELDVVANRRIRSINSHPLWVY